MIIRHPLMPIMVVFLLTAFFGFSAAESITSLKLIEKESGIKIYRSKTIFEDLMIYLEKRDHNVYA